MVVENKIMFKKIDVVNFIYFGILNEFVERVHSNCLLYTDLEFKLFNSSNIKVVSGLINSQSKENKDNERIIEDLNF